MQSTSQSVDSVTTSSASGKDLRPGRDLYLQVRARFTEKGSSLHAWCQDNDVARGRANAALFGHSDSEDARAVRARILTAAGLIPAEENQQ